jgi:DNA topoisomerase-3
MKKHSGCNLCLHPTCPQGFYVNGIASCLQCDSGVLVLDPSSGPKWKVGCNKCDVIFHLFEDAHKITVEENKECDCGAQLLKIEYKEVFKINKSVWDYYFFEIYILIT